MSLRIGVIGTGTISGIYLANLGPHADPTGPRRLDPDTMVTAVADIAPERAAARAAEFGVRALTPAQLLSDDAVDLVLNLTLPATHADVSSAAIRAGRHVYTEKPVALDVPGGRGLLDLALAHGVRIGGAPDTFLGAALQAARAIVDRGDIGEPVSGTAFMANHGHERWHPSPGFYYAPGGGPLFDMGPYYLTALISLLGPVREVTAMAGAAFAERTIAKGPDAGSTVSVTTPTHVAGVLRFAAGSIVTLVTSFDVWAHSLPNLELHGTAGSLSLGDPNTFGGPVAIAAGGAGEFTPVPIEGPFATNSRGLGITDLAASVRDGVAHRASGELTLHVLDVMESLLRAAGTGHIEPVTTTCERPAALPR